LRRAFAWRVPLLSLSWSQRMDVHRAFCSACDRTVPVVSRAPAGPVVAPAAAPKLETLECLEYGTRCTGWMCPMSMGMDDNPSRLPVIRPT